MTRRNALLVVLVAVVGIVGWYVFTHHGAKGDAGATPDVTQGSGGGAISGSNSLAGGARTGELGKPGAPASLDVLVRDGAGVLAGAAVRAQPRAAEGEHEGEDADEREVVVGKTGADGKATLALGAGAWTISASAAGHVAGSVEQTVRSGERAHVEIALVAGGRLLTGTVSDALGGPIAGARIDAAKLGAMASIDRAIAFALTGTDGRYQVTVPEGMLYVAASDPNYAPQVKSVEVGANGAVADFALVPGGVIEGIVRDERSHDAVPGATVTAARDGGGLAMFGETSHRRATTGTDGKFRIAGLRPGAYDLAAKAALKMSRSPTHLGLGVAEQVGDIEILVGTAAVIRGKVIGESGLAAGGVDVMAFGQRGDGGGDAESAADGTFAIAGLPPGRYSLVGQGGKQVADGTTPVELAEQDVTGVIVKVRPAGGITGRIDPPQVCDVRFDREASALSDPFPVRPTTSKPDGTFVLTPVSPGAGKVGARCASGDQGSAEVTVAPGAPDVVVKVVPGASIAGRVVDGAGKPVPAATVVANPLSSNEHVVVVNGMITSGAQALANLDGTYVVRGLSPGTYRMSVLSRGKPLAAVKAAVVSVAVAAAENKTGVDLAVELPDGTIAGTVVGADGKPLADAWVSVHQDFGALIDQLAGGKTDPNAPGESGSSQMVTVEAQTDDQGGGLGDIAPVLTDASGKFAIHGLSHTRYDVIAEAQQGQVRGRATNVTPDATIAITAVGVTKLTGTVKAGSPLAVFEVELDGPTKTVRGFAASGTAGTFEIARVDPGAYTVHVTSSAGNGDAKIVVKPGETATVDVALVANAVMVGKLVDPAGKPLSGIGLAVVPDSEGGGVSLSLEGPPPTSGADGTFRLEAPAGKVVLIAMTPPKPFTKRGLVLEAGKTLDVGTITIQ